MECKQCHLNFNTPPVKEPRKFKCRSCGNIFVVSPTSPDHSCSDEEVVTLETDPGKAVALRAPGPEAALPTPDACAMTYPARDGSQLRPPPPRPPAAPTAPAPRQAAPGQPQLPAGSPPMKAAKVDINTLNIPGYEIVSVLGSGGMGVVLKARQKSLDRDVAIKVLSPSLATIPRFVKRFQKEAKALSTLNHPGVVGVIDRGQINGVCYLVMEFVAGTTLRYLLQRVQITLREFLDLVIQLLESLEYIHSKGIVHRDIKPENVIISKNRRIKVADFGLACLEDPEDSQNLTRHNTGMGTLNYMAPEQRVNAAEVDCRADLYSLGVILYEIVTGELPLGAFDPPSKVNKRLSKRLDAIIIKALKSKPSERYQTARAIIDDIKGYMDNVKKKPAVEAKKVEEQPISTIRSAPGKKVHSIIPSSHAPEPQKGYDPQEEQRMWAVWQDHQRAVEEESSGMPSRRGAMPGLSRTKQATKKRPKPSQSSAPNFFEKTLEQERLLEEKRTSRKPNKIASYLVSGAVIFAVIIGIGALLLPTFPFLWRIPIIGGLMMKVRNIFLPTY